MICICMTIWRRPPCCDSVVQPWAVLITLYLFNNLTWLFDTCTKLTHAHTYVYCSMSPIRFLEETLAPCQWNGPIVDNSACNDFPFVWREQAECFHHCTLLNKAAIDFRHTVWFHTTLFTHKHTGWRGRWQQGQRSSRPSRWQSEYMHILSFPCVFKNWQSCLFINFHMHSGSSRSPRTKGRVRWSWTHCKSNNQLVLTPWLMFHSLSCRIYFFRDSRVLTETEVKQVPLGFL